MKVTLSRRIGKWCKADPANEEKVRESCDASCKRQDGRNPAWFLERLMPVTEAAFQQNKTEITYAIGLGSNYKQLVYFFAGTEEEALARLGIE